MIRITLNNKNKYISLQNVYEMLRSWSYRERFIFTDIISWLPSIIAFEIVDPVTVNIVFSSEDKIRIKDDSPNSIIDMLRILWGKAVSV